MKAGGGHLKGSRFEREICRALSMWLSRDTRDDVFWRSAMSGGRATIGLAEGIKRTAQAGDVSMISSLGELLLKHVYIECKSYTDLQVYQGIVKQTGRLYKFWQETETAAAKFDKLPMLIARQNIMPTVVILSEAGMAPFNLTVHNAVARLLSWNAYMVLFDAFVREAAVPHADLVIQRDKRVRLG